MDHTELSTLSLCTGVGMLDEGVRAACEWLGIAYRSAGMCEWEAYAAATLLARMEESALEPSPVFVGDLRDLDGRELRDGVNCIIGGFPCQPWSCAGKQQGTDDERWLWNDIVRIIGEVEPSIVFLENVPGLVSGKSDRRVLDDGREVAVRSDGLDPVLQSLAALGFDAEWCHLSAKAVGASHRRNRVFVLAHKPGERRIDQKPDCCAIEWREHASRRRDAGGCRFRLADCRGVGASESGEPEARQREQQSGRAVESGGHCGGVGDSSERGLQGRRPQRNGGSKTLSVRRARELFAPGRDRERWGGIIGESPWLAPATEPGVRVLVDGLAVDVDASRADQLRCTGNGVVPLQAAVAFVALLRRAAAASTALQLTTDD